ncbi:unnamed protein product [Adineta ricciae]|uniref:Uncharacterized protein n=1 Tax=Adineta ricciae TaxID=249248 RepID=A0A814NTG7_ADIRI|nr:unnamed protein product [Adineta ricciae]CAF1498569.1 unnamed protein product [Adineta ricciae]
MAVNTTVPNLTNGDILDMSRNSNNDDNPSNCLQTNSSSSSSSSPHIEQGPVHQSTDSNSCDKCENRSYLDGIRILNWFENKSIDGNLMIPDHVTYVYVITLASILDKWIKDDNRRKLCKAYLKLGQNCDYWAPEMFRSIQQSDTSTKIKFIEEKLNVLNNKIHSLIDDYNKCSLVYNTHRKHNCNVEIIKNLLELSGLSIGNIVFPKDNFANSTLKLQQYVRDYIMQRNEHFQKSTDMKIQRAKAHAGHFLLLKDFMKIIQ